MNAKSGKIIGIFHNQLRAVTCQPLSTPLFKRWTTAPNPLEEYLDEKRPRRLLKTTGGFSRLKPPMLLP